MTEPSLLKRIFKNLFWIATGEIGAKGILFFANIYLARVLSPAGYGLYFHAWAISMNLWVLSDLGINLYGIRETAKDGQSRNDLFNSLTSLRFLWAAVVFAGLFIVTGFLDMDPDKKIVYRIFGLNFIALSIYSKWFFKGIEKMRSMSLVNISCMGLFAAVLLFLVKKPEDAPVAAFCFVTAEFIGAVSLMAILVQQGLIKKIRLVFQPAAWKGHISRSLFFAGSGIMNQIAQYGPITLLGYLASDEIVGYFSAPYRLVLTIVSFSFLIPSAIYPVMSSCFEKDIQEFQRVHLILLKTMSFIGLPICLGVLSISDEVTLLLWGKAYENSVFPLQLLSLLIPIISIRVVFGIGLFASGNQQCHMAATLSGAVATLVGAVILIPAYQLEGACFSHLLGEVTITSMMVYFYRKGVSEVRVPVGFLCKLSVCSFIAIVALFLVKPYHLLGGIVGSISVFMVLSFLLGVISTKDIHRLVGR